MSPDPGPRAFRAGRAALWLGLGVWFIYVGTAGGSLASGDAVAMYRQATSLLDRGALDVPAEYSHPNWQGLNGRHYLAFGVAQAVYDVPFVALGRVAAPLIGWDDQADTLEKALVALGVTIPCAVSAGLTLLLAFRLSGDRRGAVLAAMLLAFGTLMWPYSKYGFNAGLAAAAVAMGTVGFAAGWLDRRPGLVLAGGAAFGVAILTRHELAIATASALVWLALESRHDTNRGRWLAAAAAGPVVAVGLWAWLNWMHFGSPLKTGHAPGFGLGGVAGLLISPSGSILLYSPVACAALALVPAFRSHPVARLVAAIIVTQTIFYMSIDDWLGTRSYGPRYIVPLLPLMTAPLALWWTRARSRHQRWAVAALCLFSVAIQLPAIPVDIARVGVAAGQPAAPARRADWTWSPILLNARATAEDVPANVRAIASGSRLAGSGGDGSLAERLSGSLNFWWMYLFHLGAIPAWLAVAIACGLFGTGAVVIDRVWRGTAGPL